MKIKICSFEEAVEMCKKNNLDYDENTALGIEKDFHLWGKVVDAEICGGLCIIDNIGIWACFATKINDEPNEFDIIHYGTIVTDDDIESKDDNFIRIRIIAYEGNIYYHKMVNGDVVEFKKIGVCE